MFSTSFRRPIGAAADAKELEYITALHQTVDDEEDDFVDGSIEAKDVKYYLMSRYGIDVETKEIQKLVFYDLAGGSDETDCIDICELVAILLIPFFVKSRRAGEFASTNSDRSNFGRSSISRAFANEKQMNEYMNDIELCSTLFSKGAVIEHVLNIIMADSTGSTEPQPITKELLTTIFARYGELGLIADDDLIEEMIEDVTGGNGNGNGLLDAESFTRALTEDVLLYNVNHETRLSTFYEDVFGMEGGIQDVTDNANAASAKARASTIASASASALSNAESKNGKNEADGESETNPIVRISRGSNAFSFEMEDDPETMNGTKTKTETPRTTPRFKNVFTCSQVDFLADSCRSKMHLAIVYLSFIFAIYYYRRPEGINSLQVCSSNSFGCQIGNSVTGWLLIMSLTISAGIPFILSTTLGNTLRGRSIRNVILGISGVVFFTLLPVIVPFDFIWLSNEITPTKEGEVDGWMSFQVVFIRVIQSCIVASLLYFQCTNLVRVIEPKMAQSNNRTLSFLFTRGTVRETFLLKLAASLKTHKMVKNALDLHFGDKDIDDSDRFQSSTNTFALLNYSKVTDKTEMVGGLWWCWKSYTDRTLIQKEGVMVNSRLLLCNILQFFLVIILCFQLPQFTVQTLAPALFPILTHELKQCDESTFDPEKCYYPSLAGAPAGLGVCHGIKMEDPSCLSYDYFTPAFYDINGADDRINDLCDGMVTFLDKANQTAWSLVLNGDKSIEFIEVSTDVVGKMLCEGLRDFNQTVWGAFSNATTYSAIESCDIPQESFCDISSGQLISALGQDKLDSNLDYQSAMDSLTIFYENKYRIAFEHAVKCLEQSTSINALNYVFNQAASSLQRTLESSIEASWSAMIPDTFQSKLTDLDIDIDQQLYDYVASTIGPELADQLLANITILNRTEIYDKISAPVLSSAADIVLIETTAMSLVNEAFLELNATLQATMKAIESNLAVLPSYVNMPYLPVKTLCSNIWNVRSNATLLVDAVNSTEDNFCRAHLTTCTSTGICLIGLDFIQQGELHTYFPFQFQGQKCSEYEGLDRIMKTKEQLGILTSYIPSMLLINFSIGVGVALSLLCLLCISILFIPNAIMTALKYRSGVLPSLRDEGFKRYRKNLTSLTLLVPIVFWSAFAMTFVFFFALCLAIFFLFWTATRGLVIQLIALIIGLVICVLMKQILVCTLGKYCYAAFYRRKPALINIASVALECWHIFLAIAFVISRAGVLILMTLLFIGRVDRTLLADDLGLDSFPHIFRQSILAADAHRHPYIERLGMMYLMKLKHGEKFGKKSASTWRLLFVFALMPWLRKYRILDDVTDVDESKIDKAYDSVNFKDSEIVQLKARIALLEKDLRLAQEKRKSDDNKDQNEENEPEPDLSFFESASSKACSPLSALMPT